MFTALRQLFAFPLLHRELTERAARSRTYWIRIGYGLVLYGLFIVATRRIDSAPGQALAVMGMGRDLFHQLMEVQLWAVLLLQPALLAGSLTYEKERDSLSLLLLTGMSPMRMLLEKYFAGLLPMATLLLLALPLGAVCMAYGGVSLELLAASAIVLVGAWAMVGALALLCSAWCRSSVGAFLLAYALGALVLFLPAIIYSLSVRYVLWGADLRGVDVPGWLWAHWPQEALKRVFSVSFESLRAAWEIAMQASAPLWTLALVSLLLARLILLPRASAVAPRASWEFASHWLLEKWLRLRQKSRDLPVDEPVAWRESGRSVLGRSRDFFYRVMVALAAVLVVSFILLGLYPRTAGTERLQHLLNGLGAVAVLVLTVRAIGSVLSEHANQTLDILLTTSLGAAQILREKARALYRYWIVFGLMFWFVSFLQPWSEFEYLRREAFWREVTQSWLCSLLALLVYPPLILWLSLLCALMMRARARALAAALGFMALWFLGPLVLLELTVEDWREKPRALWFSLTSPLGILDANRQGTLARFDSSTINETWSVTIVGRPWTPIAANFTAYAALLIAIRGLCLSRADAWLRR